MVSFFRRLLRKPNPDETSLQLVSETDGGKMFTLVTKNVCPSCGSHSGFFAGPEGGISQNVFCANVECRAGFNITPMVGTCDKIGTKGDPERYPDSPERMAVLKRGTGK